MLVKNVGLPNKEARSLGDENLVNIRLLTKLSKDKKLKKKIEVIKPHLLGFRKILSKLMKIT